MFSLTLASIVLAFSTQQTCFVLSGLVQKSTRVAVSGAFVQIDQQANAVSDRDGTFASSCLPAGQEGGGLSKSSAAPAVTEVNATRGSTLTHQPGPDVAEPLADRKKELAALLEEMWQNTLRDNPTFASSLGDRRYTRLLPDVSPAKIDEGLHRDAICYNS